MRQLISRFLHDETGATAIEYSIIAVGISIVIVASVLQYGWRTCHVFSQKLMAKVCHRLMQNGS